MKPKLVRITTVPISLEKLLENQHAYMAQHYDVLLVSSGEEHLNRVAQSQGVRAYAVEMTRKITPLQDLKAVIKLYKFLKKEKPLIVHSHTPKAGTVGMIAAKLAGVPYRLHTVAGLPLLLAKGNKRRMLDAVEKITYAAATNVYPNSFGLRDIIVKNGYCKPQKLKVIGHGSSNGINTAHFDPALFSAQQIEEVRNQYGIGKDDTVFIFIGRLVKDKGIREIVSAFSEINAKNPLTKLLLVGRYEPDLDMIDAETQSEIQNNPAIIETGYQKDVRPFMMASDILTFPSYREGFPNVVLQAAAMQLPAIVTDINGCNEIIHDGENGLIVPPADAQGLKLAMERLLADPELRGRMKRRSREEILERYEQRLVWQKIHEEYRRLTGISSKI